MGILRRIADALSMTADVAAGPKFADGNVIDWDAIPPQFFGISQAPEGVAPLLSRVPRRWAMAVPGVKRGRDLICTPIGGLPLRTYNANRQDVTGELLMQPERDVPRVVTFSRLVEDLLFESRAWWRITETYGPKPYDFPKHVRRIKPRNVDTSRPGEVWVTDDETGKVELVDSSELIRFDSPTDGVLWAGAGAIATVLMLDKRAYRSAENPTPDGYFTPYDGQDPFDEEDDTLTDEEQAALYTAKTFLAEWQQSRLLGTQGYVPGGVKYEQLQWDPKAMQLAEARQHAVLEIARLMGLEPEDLGVPVTSRTYFNAETKRRDRIDFTLGMFMDAIQDRLSMPDVTPRGQYVRYDVDHFLRTDTATRLQNYQLGRDLGLYDLPYMREREDLPPVAEPAPTQEAPAVDNVRQLPTGQAASARPAATFSSDLLVMSAPAVDQAFRVDVAKRQITGTVVPYGGAQAYSKGSVYQFSEGTIAIPQDVTRVKFYVNHDENQAIGHAISLTDGPERLVGTFQLDTSPEADRALQKANDKVWDGLSGGFRQGGQFKAKDGVQFAVSAPLGEVSLCPSPAFDDARVSAVALSNTAATEGNTAMPCTKCGQIHAHGVTACDPAAVAAFSAATAQQFGQQNPQTGQTGQTGQTAPTATGQPAAPIELSAVTEAIQNGFTALQGNLLAAVVSPQREWVPANGQGGQQFTVREELPYRFNGSTSGEHCFTDDLRDSQSGNHEAAERLHRFMAEAFMPAPDPKINPQFAVTTTNVGAFNPTQNRPDLYVPNLQYTRPLWDAVSTGTIENQSPFNIPKFASASGLVGPHTQGVEPTPGAFSATVQTVTPTPVSGKVEINREVWDLGGNPQTDTIVWNEMQNAYFEGIETNIATMLNALAAATLYTGAEINLGGAVDAALNTALTNLLVDLQFVRGGNRYSAAAADGMLYKALATAKDGSGRPLFPLLNPTNANGQLESAGSPASAINVAGQVFRPAWALNQGVANAYNSYLFVPGSVWAWASPPKRFTFEYQVKSIDMAVWGYTGSAVLRNSDVARIDYTTADV